MPRQAQEDPLVAARNRTTSDADLSVDATNLEGGAHCQLSASSYSLAMLSKSGRPVKQDAPTLMVSELDVAKNRL